MLGNRILAMMLKQLADRVGYVLVVARGDAKVLLLGTDNAPNRLVSINSASPLEHDVFAYATPHYRAIVASLKRRFGALAEDGFGLWFHIDPSEICAAIEEFDLASGVRTRDGIFELAGRVWVKDFGPGEIQAFTDRGARVRLDRHKGGLHEVLSPRSLMKPYLRAVA